MIDTSSQRQIDARTVTVNARDPFIMQDHVAQAVAEMLGVSLDMDELRTARRTQTPAAYDFYLEGRGYLQDYDKPENLDNAISLFQKALNVADDFALGYAGLGQAFWKKYEFTKDVTWVGVARGNCDRALSLDASVA